MRIVIDMQGAQSTGSWNRGIGRYTMSLALAIVRQRGEHEISLALNGAFPESVDRIRTKFNGLLPQDQIHVWHAIPPMAHLDSRNNGRRLSGELIREAFLDSLKPDFVLVSSLFEGLSDDAVTSISRFSASYSTAVILYDLIPYIHKQTYLENQVIETWYLEKIDYLRRADLWLAISQSSCQEGIGYLALPAEQCFNISTDADAHFQKITVSNDVELEIREKYGLHKGIVMYTGGIDHRKNIEGLIRAYARLAPGLRSTHQLAIVCSVQEDSRNRLLSLAKAEGLHRDEVILTGFVSEDDLIALYNLCAVFVFPSWHEGFGLPALEAMRCGAPVIAANTSSLPEVLGLEDALFDPYSDAAIASAIERVLTDTEFRRHLIAHGTQQARQFSWNESARRALVAMSNAEQERRARISLRPSSGKRPKLAYVSPLPPERSGISDYSAELLPSLALYYQIEVVVEKNVVTDPWVLANCPIRSIEWFTEHTDHYDRVLYHFGNSAFHQHMFTLLVNFPGVVVLHDFYLSGVRHHMEALGYMPEYFTEQLFRSHGYKGLHDRACAMDVADVIWKYPCSRDVIENSLGTIAHSLNTVHLAKQWYGDDGCNWSVIPHMRAPAEVYDAQAVRKALGFTDSDFVVCSFGLLGPTKLNHRLLKAWFDSDISKAANCYLVFVGENHTGDYGSELLSLIKRHPKGKRVRITGWADQETFRNYLAVANLGVQLRTLSRGETSGTVLDCMNYGVATIVNANGSMLYLDDDAVFKLQDDFSDKELVNAIESLWLDDERRKKIGEKAKSLIAEQHDPARCAKQYQDAIEGFYAKNVPVYGRLLNEIAVTTGHSCSTSELMGLASAIALSFPKPWVSSTLFVDISALVQGEAKTGIQLAMCGILKSWLLDPPNGYCLEPVYAEVNGCYRYARTFTAEFLGITSAGLFDDPVEYVNGDFFIGLAMQPQVQTAHRSTYQFMRRQGVSVQFVVCDLLPVLQAQYFPPGTEQLFAHWLEVVCESDGAICITKAVADELLEWRAGNCRPESRAFRMDWFHLGVGVEGGKPPHGLSTDMENILSKLRSQPTLLMVGALEPSKGHLQVLDAVHVLWGAGINVNLVIVGRTGWMVDELVARLRSHPEFGQRLFLLDEIIDEYVEKIFAACTCLIAASYGEGFGLPLIEAAKHKLPIIARDIPVFREVAGEHAYYFQADQPEQLALAIQKWLVLRRENAHPKSENMHWLTWEKSAKQLADAIFGRKND